MTDARGIHSGNDYNMKDENYPGLFQMADAASRQAQKTYLFLQRVHLGSLVLGSAIAALTALQITALNAWLYTAIAIILTLGLLILWIIRARQDDKRWFDCRAIAESVKTATWRFMMNAPPFQDDNSVDNQFISELREIRQARPDSGKHLAAEMDVQASAITDVMRQMRSLPFDDRKSFYLDSRVRNQKDWYSKKAKTNAERGSLWYWATAGFQAVAVAIAITQAVSGGWRFNFVPLLTTCAAAVAAWSQMKRHDELAQAYALAAQELGELESIVGNTTIERNFPQLVEQVEEAISREHTMWCARRDVPPSGRTGRKTR